VSYFVTENLIMEPVDKGWRLLTPLKYYSETLGQEIKVPAGFFTDLASVPRLFRWLVPVANAKNVGRRLFTIIYVPQQDRSSTV
jgi:hypothetical protein